MTLRYTSLKTVRADLEKCVECILRADRLLSSSSYTAKVEEVSPGVYHVRFKWRKWGMTRYYDVTFRVRKEDDTIVYESVEGSKYPMRFRFKLSRADGDIRVEVEASMEAGLMADLLGKKDFAKFVDELVETGIVALMRKLASEEKRAVETPGRPSRASCKQCLLYDPARGYCYYLRRSVENPEEPPCKGKAFLPG